MNAHPSEIRWRCISLLTWGVVACATPDMTTTPGGPQFARAAGGITVTATDPPYGKQGESGKLVSITGSGFASGDQASWERNGVADPKITIVSTQFASSTELRATINIAGDATLAFYDVAIIRSGRKGGIGTERFEVTQATPIAGTEVAYGVNAAGEAVGRVGPPGAFYFNQGTGLELLGAPGRAFDISDDGQSVVGFTGVCCYGAFLYARSGGSWSQTILPKGPAPWASARAVGSDPTTGAAVVIGGMQGNGYNKNLGRKPVLWLPSLSTWTLVNLPTPGTDDVLDDVVGNGTAVGTVTDRAAVWEPTGPGTWGLTLIGTAGSRALGVNTAGTLVVGESSTSGNTTAARYWQKSGSTWSGPFALPGGCSSAVAVDDAGRIAANGCTDGSRRTAAVISPPYASSDVTYLGGLGDAKNEGIVEAMSRTGGWLAGQAKLKSVYTGVTWQVY